MGKIRLESKVGSKSNQFRKHVANHTQGHAFSEDYRGQQQLSHDQNNALLYDLEVAQNSSAVNGQTEGTGLNDLWWANWNNLPGLDQFDMNNQTYDFG